MHFEPSREPKAEPREFTSAECAAVVARIGQSPWESARVGGETLYDAVVATYALFGARESLLPEFLQAVHRRVRTAMPVPVEALQSQLETASAAMKTEERLALAELAVAAGRWETGRRLLAAVYVTENCDFRFQDLWFRLRHYQTHGMPEIEDIGFEKRGQVCMHALVGMIVDATGDVFPCCGPMVTKALGNIAKVPVEEAMNTPFAHRFRKSVVEGSYRFCSKIHCPTFQGALVPREELPQRRILRNEPPIDDHEAVRIPRWIELALDRSCNLSCPFCRAEIGIQSKQEQRFWDLLLRKRLDPILREAQLVTFSGTGDPFVSRPYLNLMKRLNRAQYPELWVQLFTNGLLMTRERWAEYAHLNGMIGHLSVSIDAASEAVYRVMRRGGDFWQLRSHLEFFRELRDEGSVQTLKLNFLVQRDNFFEMEAFFDMACEAGADIIHFQRLANISQEDTEGGFMAKRVDLPAHPRHAEFLEMVGRPFMRDPRVEHGFALPRTVVPALQVF